MAELDFTELSELTKIKVNGLRKRKAPPSSVTSKHSKRKHKSDTSSVFSLTTSLAYGARDVEDPDDPDDEEIYDESISVNEKPLNFVNLDLSTLNRENGILFSEDLTDKYEIWTLQCPDDVNISELQDKKIDFDNVSSLKIPNSMSEKVDVIPYKNQEKTTMTIITPSENTKKLSLNIVPLAGTIILSNRVKKIKLENQNSLPVDTIEDATRRRSELFTKITQRLSQKYDLSSTETQIENEKVTPKKRKAETLNMSNRVKQVKLEYQTELPVGFDTTDDENKKKKSAKKSTQNDCTEIQFKEEVESPRKIKKKSKRKSTS
ncbi:Hypothetical protein CINCED_3A019261 [Cinara cedri]|uniref:Uncharacterized protein n=1 Tax=Cinara cedri TaxID=506608 RepID=A0A5E4NDS0_9HEMI|nr:Hypothetical protein CINCED_3A019261 [Cinara cedri]